MSLRHSALSSLLALAVLAGCGTTAPADSEAPANAPPDCPGCKKVPIEFRQAVSPANEGGTLSVGLIRGGIKGRAALRRFRQKAHHAAANPALCVIPGVGQGGRQLVVLRTSPLSPSGESGTTAGTCPISSRSWRSGKTSPRKR